MPRWSPDGRRLSFYSGRSGTLQLWVLDLKRGETVQITNVTGGISPNPLIRFMGWGRDPLRYSWSPDGTKIVFASQMELRPSERSKATKQSRVSKHTVDDPIVLTATSPPSWGLSGVFRSNQLDRYFKGRYLAGAGQQSPRGPLPRTTDQLFVVDVVKKTTERITQSDFDSFNPDWSPDGKRIAFASTEGRPIGVYGSGGSNIYLLDLQTRTSSALTTGDGEKRLPYWSPDGEWIAYIGGRHFGRQGVYVVPATGGRAFDITAGLDRFVYMFDWSSDGRSILIACVDGVSAPIVRAYVPSGRIERLTTKDASYWPFTASHNGTLVWVQSDGSKDGVFYVADSRAENARVLLELNPQVGQWSLGKQEVLRWKNSHGDDIEGIFIKPVDYQEGGNYPVVVDLYSSRINSFMASPMMGNQVLASRGYAVFLPNHRAPHTVQDLMKNEVYSQIARGPEGTDVMFDDVMTGINLLVKQGLADPDRMCLYGFSNGGGSVYQLVTKTSRFKCVVSAAGVLPDWALGFFLNAVGSRNIADLMGSQAPWENPKAYADISPVYHLDKVTTPVLLAVGDQDVDSLLQTLEVYYGLRYLRRDVTLLRYPDQGHGFTGAALKDYWQRVNAFLDCHLGYQIAEHPCMGPH
jgi:dipeptidyl aminopeptidase/acylaminoacyl peptidase